MYTFTHIEPPKNVNTQIYCQSGWQKGKFSPARLQLQIKAIVIRQKNTIQSDKKVLKLDKGGNIYIIIRTRKNK